MDIRTEELLDRTFGFGVAVLRFLATLPPDQAYRVSSYQVAKASTSIGANYEEAQAAESRKDFVHKIGISLKEARESHYWLRVIHALLEDPTRQKTARKLIQEAEEYKKIFTSIKLSAEEKNNRRT
jgi:four helix bundle protein